jgi:hypothetical protein
VLLGLRQVVQVEVNQSGTTTTTTTSTTVSW